MTTTDDTTITTARTPSGYAASWALFADWCEVTGSQALPADPGTVVEFLTGCPAAPETLRRRVAAIDHHHTATGYAPPGRSAAVLAALGRSTGEIGTEPKNRAAVQAALRALPSHGWTQGMFGRRDRCLLVLSQLAGVPYRHLAALAVGDITLTDGTATVTAAARSWSIEPVYDSVVCGPCAVVRWLRVLDIAVTKISTGAVAKAVDEADPVTARSPHLCRSTRTLDPKTMPVPVLTPINQWGALPFPHPRLTPHSQSRRTRDLLAGDIAAHRALPVPTDEPHQEPMPPKAQQVRAGYDRAAAEQAWTTRRADLHRIAGVDDVLSDIDQQIADLQDRVAALLDEYRASTPITPR